MEICDVRDLNNQKWSSTASNVRGRSALSCLGGLDAVVFLFCLSSSFLPFLLYISRVLQPPMENPYIVSRPMYGGPPSQGPPLSFAPVGAPRGYLSHPSSGPYGYSSLPSSYRGPPSPEPYAEDMPNLRGSPGLIILCIFLMMLFSMFACLGRADFNFVLYLLGYHIWCIESDTKTTAGLRRLVRGARQFAVLLSIATLVDMSWHFVAFSSWVCEKDEPHLCFPEPPNLQVRWTYGMHRLALSLSLVNLLLKALVIFLTFSWVQQQRKILGITASRGTAISPPEGAPITLCD